MSVLYGCYCLHRCRHILTSREEILALRSSATPQLRTCSEQPPPTPPTSYGILDIEGAIRHAMDNR